MAIRVIDTDVWSYLYKGHNEAKLYQPHILGNALVISFQTQAELLRWATASNWGQQRREHLRSRLQEYEIEHSSETPDATADQFQWLTHGLPQSHFTLGRR